MISGWVRTPADQQRLWKTQSEPNPSLSLVGIKFVHRTKWLTCGLLNPSQRLTCRVSGANGSSALTSSPLSAWQQQIWVDLCWINRQIRAALCSPSLALLLLVWSLAVGGACVWMFVRSSTQSVVVVFVLFFYSISWFGRPWPRVCRVKPSTDSWVIVVLFKYVQRSESHGKQEIEPQPRCKRQSSAAVISVSKHECHITPEVCAESRKKVEGTEKK